MSWKHLALLCACAILLAPTARAQRMPPSSTDRMPLGASGSPVEQRAHANVQHRPAAQPSLDDQRISTTSLKLKSDPACSIIAYQSWLDYNWEIVTAAGDGSNITRLTTNTAADEGPSLVTPSRRLAFSSDRTGQVDIFFMDLDGANPARLTTHGARDVLPVLRPDGAALAFQSYRDGAEPEVYTVNADGSALTRLTFDGHYDGQPAWSPDGSQIAFISDRTGVKNIWLMNADGSNQRQLTNLSTCGGPQWSPDGQRIAFACDDLGSEFYALWVIHADGSDPHLVYRAPGTWIDVWPGDWSPDGQYIIYEHAFWDYDTSWYVSASRIEIIDPDNTSDLHVLVALGTNMAPTWALIDDTAPSSSVDLLPTVSESPLLLSWSGMDLCSPPVSYQVQYRPAGQATWSYLPGTTENDWLTETQRTFTWAGSSQILYFRSRARDAQGNVEAWPSGNGDTRTSFATSVSGRVIDCNGVPIAGAIITGPLPLSLTAITGPDGRYELPAASSGAVTLEANAVGYQRARLKLPAVDGQEGLVHLLPAQPQLLSNGDFEQGQVGWFASGSIGFHQLDTGYDTTVARLGTTPAQASDNVASSAPAPLARTDALWRMVTIDPDIYRPTLSLLYVLGDGEWEQAGELTLSLTHNQQTTRLARIVTPTVWSALAGGERFPLWTPIYADLSAWSGETVELRLSYNPQSTATYCLIDNVFLCPWYAPRVSRVDPARVPPNTASTLTIIGENFQGLPGGGPPPPGALVSTVLLGDTPLLTTFIDSHTLQASLAGTHSPGRYDIWVSVSTGYRSALPLGFTIGYPVHLPLLQR